jgi:hypothetical protein
MNGLTANPLTILQTLATPGGRSCATEIFQLPGIIDFKGALSIITFHLEEHSKMLWKNV